MYVLILTMIWSNDFIDLTSALQFWKVIIEVAKMRPQAAKFFQFLKEI